MMMWKIFLSLSLSLARNIERKRSDDGKEMYD